MPSTLTDSERQQIHQAIAAAAAQAEGRPVPLESSLLHSTHHAEVPLWLALCREALLRNGFMPEAASERRAIAAQLAGAGEGALMFDAVAGFQMPPASHHPLAPEEVAALALGQGDPGWPGAARPATAEQQLLVDWLEDHWPPAHARAFTLDLTQMLVTSRRGPEHSGVLARLQLWLLPVDADGVRSCNGRLLRAPGAALLPADGQFADGLARVQRLLDQVLVPGAPGVAWSLRPLPATDVPQPPALAAVEGNSATAALAYGALWLLRDHLLPAHAALADQLADAEPATISITAALDGPLPQPRGMPAAPFVWPRLVRVGGVDDKFAALARTPPGRPVLHRYVAHDQQAGGVLPGIHPIGLDDLVAAVARDANGGLDDDARRLHRLLAADDEPVTDRALLRRVARPAAPPTSLKGFLVWRYALRASGSHTAFGDPVRLDQHFVRMVLAAAGPDDGRSTRQEARQPEEFTLDQLLRVHPHSSVPAWCVEAPPFCGKTTLLAERECSTARKALQAGRQHGRWGEVSVFVPLKGFKTRPPLPPGAGDVARQALVQAFVDFVQRQAPGLPPLAEVLAGQGAGQGLQLRLLIDGLNELPAADFDERSRVVRLLCSWLAQHRGPLLAPVFTVRVQENGLDLAADDGQDWRARTATLLPWQRDDWRHYIGLRQLQPAARDRLHTALRLDRDDVQEGAGDTAFESFCRSPGILAAQCTLLEHWPQLVPPTERATLFLALLWSCLDARGADLPGWLLPPRLRGERALQQAAQRNWRLPKDPGDLVDHLRRQADAMHQPVTGEPLEEWPWQHSPPGLDGDDAQAWREAVIRLGLAAENFDGQFGFTHQQWREFFAALGAGLQQPLPDLAPPPLKPAPGQPLLHHLEKRGAELELPRVTPHQERIRFAVQLSSDPDTWIRQLMVHNLPLAARVAIDHLPVLEPGEHWSGDEASEPVRRPVLQHLRRLLLLHSMDAGAAVRSRLQAGAVLGDSPALAALAPQMPGFDDELDAHWAQAWKAACQGEGVDIRRRLEAGFLLGELGDTLRFERKTVRQPDGTQRTGLRLRNLHWAGFGQPGGARQWFRVGTDDGGRDDERPSRLVDFDPFQVARYPVTVGEWRWFLQGGGYASSALPWWQAAGKATCDWLHGRLARVDGDPAGIVHWLWSDQRYSNPLQPVIAVTAYEVLAYAAWASGFAGPRAQFAVPTEDRWEAAVRGTASAQQPRQGAGWLHAAGPGDPGPLDFNHGSTRFGLPSPVGCFGLGASAHGVFDAPGNVWEWCANHPDQPGSAVPPTGDWDLRALRGGAFHLTTGNCRPAYRGRGSPGSDSYDIGVRLVRCWLPHSEP